MFMNRIIILGPVFAGVFRILLAYNIIIINAPILAAAASTLYITLGLYALQHALKNLKDLPFEEQNKHHIFFSGFCILFIAKRTTDLYHYLSPIYNFHINPSLYIFTYIAESSYSPFIATLATNLPIIALTVLTLLTLYHLITTESTSTKTPYQAALKIIDFSFILISSLFCIANIHTSVLMYCRPGLIKMIPLPSYLLTLSNFYEPLASLVLFAPRFEPAPPKPAKGVSNDTIHINISHNNA